MARHDLFDEGPRPADRLLAWPRVRDLTGLSRTTAWRLQKAGDFPLPVQISPGRVGWRESEIAAWNESRTPRVLTSAVVATRRSNGATPPVVSGDATAPPARRPLKTRLRLPNLEGQSSFEF